MSEQALRFWKGLAPLVLSLLPVLAVAQEIQPLRAPNLSPPVAIVGLPVWSEVSQTPIFGVSTEVANHYRQSIAAGDVLRMDGETVRLRAYYQKPVGDKWSLQVDVPYIHQSGGVLDDVIDGWHSIFNMPDGGRNFRPEGALEYRFAAGGSEFYQLGRSASGLGDIQLGFSRRIGDDTGLTLSGAVKLPTGDEDVLAGSGAMDFSVSLLRVRQTDLRGRASGYFYGLSLIDIGTPENVLFRSEDYAVAAIIGAGVGVSSRIGFTGQIDLHTAVYDSPLEEIGQTSVQATVAAWFRIGDDSIFEFAVSEDLHVSTTPDVVLNLNFKWHLD